MVIKMCRMTRWSKQCLYHQDLTASTSSPENLLLLLKDALQKKRLRIPNQTRKMTMKMAQSQIVTWKLERTFLLFMETSLQRWCQSR
ncbi:unnamed protein product, partial [Gulo gulo]